MNNPPASTRSDLPDALLFDIQCTLQHARTFIVSREKMHPHGVELFDEVTEQLVKARATRQVDAPAPHDEGYSHVPLKIVAEYARVDAPALTDALKLRPMSRQPEWRHSDQRYVDGWNDCLSNVRAALAGAPPRLATEGPT
jgi:hypothetical protein